MADALGHLIVGRQNRRILAVSRFGQHLTISASLALLGVGAGLFGQTTPPGQFVRFTVFSARPISDIAFVGRATGGPQKIVFESTTRSPRYEHRGPMPLKFVDVNSGATVAEANIPPNIHDALLLFAPVESGEGKANVAGARLRYQVSVIDDSAVRHAAGGLAILNLSGLALSGTVNKERVTLKPGLNPTLAVGHAAEISLSTVARNRTYRTYANTVALRRDERALLILYPPYYKGSFEVQSRLLIDQPPGAATSATSAAGAAPRR